MLRRFVWMLMPLALAWGGGFYLVVQNKDAGLTVEAQGCQDYSHARITGQAEGIVNGKRQSMSLELTPTEKPGTYAVRRQWPAEGKWVLIFSGMSGERHTYTLVDPAAGERNPRMTMRPVTAEEIEAALR
ncbi:MAG: hypothetical protein ABSG56_30265 [Bryobacteraceae bacterium]|jgi:hypothetical protein